MTADTLPPHVRQAFVKFSAHECQESYQRGYTKGKSDGQSEILAGMGALTKFLPSHMNVMPTHVPSQPMVMLSQPVVEPSKAEPEDDSESELDDLLDSLFGGEWDRDDKQNLLALAMLAVQEALTARGEDPAPVIARLKAMAGDEQHLDAMLAGEKAMLAWVAGPAKQWRGRELVTAVWDGADGQQRQGLSGKKAEMALSVQGRRTPKEEATKHLGFGSDMEGESSGVLGKLTSGKRLTQSEWDDFEKHLPHLRVSQLKELRNSMLTGLLAGTEHKVKSGRNKAQRMQGLKEGVGNLIGGILKSKPVKKDKSLLMTEPTDEAIDPVDLTEFDAAADQPEGHQGDGESEVADEEEAIEKLDKVEAKTSDQTKGKPFIGLAKKANDGGRRLSQGDPINFNEGEFAGMTGKVEGIISARYGKEDVTYRIQIDGYPKPGGWSGKITETAAGLMKRAAQPADTNFEQPAPADDKIDMNWNGMNDDDLPSVPVKRLTQDEKEARAEEGNDIRNDNSKALRNRVNAKKPESYNAPGSAISTKAEDELKFLDNNKANEDKKADAEAISKGVAKQKAGKDRWLDFAKDSAGLSDEEADNAFKYLLKHKLAKFDSIGQFQVKHGGLVSPENLKKIAAEHADLKSKIAKMPQSKGQAKIAAENAATVPADAKPKLDAKPEVAKAVENGLKRLAKKPTGMPGSDADWAKRYSKNTPEQVRQQAMNDWLSNEEAQRHFKTYKEYGKAAMEAYAASKGGDVKPNTTAGAMASTADGSPGTPKETPKTFQAPSAPPLNSPTPHKIESAVKHNLEELLLEKHHGRGMVPLADIQSEIEKQFGPGHADVALEAIHDLRRSGQLRVIDHDTPNPRVEKSDGFRSPADADRPRVDSPPVPPTSEIRNAAEKYIADIMADPKSLGMVPIHEIRKRIGADFGSGAASHKVFDEVLHDMHRDGHLRMLSIDDKSRATQDQLTGSIDTGAGTKFYVEPTASPTPAPHPHDAKIAALQAKDTSEFDKKVAAIVAKNPSFKNGEPKLEDFEDEDDFDFAKNEYGRLVKKATDKLNGVKSEVQKSVLEDDSIDPAEENRLLEMKNGAPVDDKAVADATLDADGTEEATPEEIVPKPSVVAPKQKHEMTKAEYLKKYRGIKSVQQAEQAHRNDITKAMADGKTIPPSVLNDYGLEQQKNIEKPKAEPKPESDKSIGKAGPLATVVDGRRKLNAEGESLIKETLKQWPRPENIISQGVHSSKYRAAKKFFKDDPDELSSIAATALSEAALEFDPNLEVDGKKASLATFAQLKISNAIRNALENKNRAHNAGASVVSGDAKSGGDESQSVFEGASGDKRLAQRSKPEVALKDRADGRRKDHADDGKDTRKGNEFTDYLADVIGTDEASEENLADYAEQFELSPKAVADHYEAFKMGVVEEELKKGSLKDKVSKGGKLTKEEVDSVAKRMGVKSAMVDKVWNEVQVELGNTKSKAKPKPVKNGE